MQDSVTLNNKFQVLLHEDSNMSEVVHQDGQDTIDQQINAQPYVFKCEDILLEYLWCQKSCYKENFKKFYKDTFS